MRKSDNFLFLLKIPCAVIALMMCIGISNAEAQSTVKGVVNDDGGQPLIGATVTVPGTTIGTTTGAGGVYELRNVPAGASLLFSFIGYESQEIQVGARTEINVVLVSDSQTLDDVIVIGYGTVRKSDLTGSVSKISSEVIGDRPLARAESALQGTMPGVQVRTTSGEPGADLVIRVRGAASINASADPLYVVDGVPTSTLAGLNASDIESMEVLKDAASAAIYGSRGSNGVVLVTTKKGRPGHAVVTFNASFGVQQVQKKIDLLSGPEWIENYIKMQDINYSDAMEAAGIAYSVKDSNATRLRNLGLTAMDTKYNYDERWQRYVSQDIYDAHTWEDTDETLDMLDWQDHFFRIAPVHDYNVGITGGTDNVTYNVSVGYFDQKGVSTGTGYKRISALANIDAKINKWASAGVKIAPTYSLTDGGDQANGKDTRIHHVLASSPVSESGVGYNVNVEPNDRYLWGSSWSSPSVVINQSINKKWIMRLNSQAYLRLTPVKGLSVEGLVATNYYDMDEKYFLPTSATSSWANGPGTASAAWRKTEKRFDNSLMQVVANYMNTFGKHNITLMAGASNEQNNWGNKTDQRYSIFPNDNITGSFNGNIVNADANTVIELNPDRLISYFGRVNYGYDNRYLVSGSLRYDGGSVFGANNKWGLFPAVSGAWRLSEEKFWKNLDIDYIFSQVKIRASYGVTGNKEISRDASFSLLEEVKYAGSIGFRPSSYGNAELGWEKTKSTDIAIDLSFLRNRINLSLDWYTKKTTDLLYEVPVPAASGFRTYWDNIGDIKNRGFEVELNSVNMQGEVKWTTSFNYSFNKNKVLRLGDDNASIYSGFDGIDTGNKSNVLGVGLPINSFYMYQAVGVWKSQAEIDSYINYLNDKNANNPDWTTVTALKATGTIQPGDVRYLDLNEDGVIDDNDRVVMGSPNPRNYFGLTNTVEWKNFDFSILITAQTGGKIYGVLGRQYDRPGMGVSPNALGRWRNAWWSEDDPGDGNTPYIGRNSYGNQADSRWLYSSNYLAIKNLTIGYKIPFKTEAIKYARVYFMIENLANFNNYYGGYSPEAANLPANVDSKTIPGGGTSMGLDYFSYPLARVYSFGVNFTF